jgi:hypothetical protein
MSQPLPTQMAVSAEKPSRPPAYLSRLPAPTLGDRPPWHRVPVAEAADILGVSLRTLRRWRDRGIGPSAIAPGTYGGNRYWYEPAELVAFYEACTQPAARTVDEVIDDWVVLNESRYAELTKAYPPPAVRRTKMIRLAENRRAYRRRVRRRLAQRQPS